MSKTRLPPADGEPFIERMEEEQAACNLEFVSANMLRLERIIALYQERIYELAQLQFRARSIRERHEPEAPMRKKKRA